MLSRRILLLASALVMHLITLPTQHHRSLSTSSVSSSSPVLFVSAITPDMCRFYKQPNTQSCNCADGSVRNDGDTYCHCTCLPGYALTGYWQCSGGAWDSYEQCDPIPTCTYYLPSYGTSATCGNGGVVNSGTTCAVQSCQTNYVPSGSKTCSGGSWSGSDVCTYSPPPCTNYQIPANSDPSNCSPGGTYADGSSCFAGCHGGYTSSGPGLYCSAGTWTGSQTCNPNGCTYSHPANSVDSTCSSGSSYPSGTSCTASCTGGASSSGSHYCSAGSWVSQQVCTPPAGCNYKLPSHATSSTCSGYVGHGTTCYITGCQQYYDGGGSITCNNGAWQSDSQYCSYNPPTCSYSLPSNTASSSCGNGQTVSLNGQCSISCASGYSLSGGTMTCTASGWSGSHSCQPKGCTYSLPSHGTVSSCSGAVGHGSVCYLQRCDQYYDASGTIECYAGSWRYDSQACTYNPPKCTYALPSNTASNSCSNNQVVVYTQQCDVTCAGGYTLNGAAQTCTGSGWSNTQSCSPSPCTYHLPSNGVSATGAGCTEGGSISSGTMCTLASCATNYVPSGSVSCNLGAISGTQTCTYVPPCTYALPQYATGSTCDVGTSYPGGTQCTGTCPAGTTRSGVDTCTSGAFSGQTCVPNSCTNYVLPSFATVGNCVSGSTQSHTTACQATCNGGYTSQGSDTCSFGTWSKGQSCQPNSCSYTLPSNGVSATPVGCTNNAVITSGTTCTLASCATNYVPSGSVTCNAGSISGSHTCTYVPPCTYALPQYATGSTCNVGTSYPGGTQCTGTCPAGTTRSGFDTCTSGAFSGQTCVPDSCPSYSLPSFSTVGNCGAGSTQTHTKSCQATCNSGYTSQGSDTCSFGSWSKGQTCQPNGCTYNLPSNGVSAIPGLCTNGAMITSGTTCTLQSCATNYVPSGSISCNAGSISGTQTCTYVPPCTYALPQYATGSTCDVGTSYPGGKQCTATCPAGTTKSGVDTCTSGAFSGQTCSPNSCTNYVAPSFSTSSTCGSDSTQLHGTTCTATCQATYSPVGTTTCSFGTWSYGQTCQPPAPCATGYVQPLNAVSSDCTIGSTQPEGTICTATCGNGYVSSGTNKCSGGAWTNGQVCGPQPCNNYQLPALATSANCTTGASKPSGTICAPTVCNNGYSVSGGISCSFGVWSTNANQCTPSPCTNYQPATNVETASCSTGSTYTDGKTCTSTCKSGYTLTGTDSCTLGAWNYNTKCTPNPCTTYQLPTNSDSSNCTAGQTILSGEKCTAVCSNGYTAIGGASTCLAGTWTKQTCALKPCTNYVRPTYTINSTCADSSTQPSGTKCISTCQTGYVNNGTTQCNLGIWTYGESCLPKPCTNYKLPKNSLAGNCAAGVTVQSGVNCTAVCKGKAVNNNGTSQCSFGVWTEGQSCYLSSLITGVMLTTRNAAGGDQHSISSLLTPPFDPSERSYRITLPFAAFQLQVQPVFSDLASGVKVSYYDPVSTSVSFINGALNSPDYLSSWISLNSGGGDFTFNLTSVEDGSYMFTVNVPPQYILAVTKQPTAVYVNARTSVFTVDTASVLPDAAFPITLTVECAPKPQCQLSNPTLTLVSPAASSASFTLIVKGMSSGIINITFTAADRAHILPPAFLLLPITPQQKLTIAGPTSAYSYVDTTFTVKPSVMPTESFTVMWEIENPTTMPGSLVQSSVQQKFDADANPALVLPLALIYRGPTTDVPTQTIRLIGTITTVSGATGSQFENPMIEFTLKGAQRFSICGDSLSVYVSGGSDASSTGVYTSTSSINGKPHYTMNGVGTSNWHLYYYSSGDASTKNVGSWILDFVASVSVTPSASALYNSDDSAPFSAAWRQYSTSIAVGMLTVVCAPDCSKVGSSSESIESSVCSSSVTSTTSSCSLSCSRYLPAVTSTCSFVNSTLPVNVTARISDLTSGCSSCNLAYVSSVMQKCGATLTSSDLTSDMSEVLTFPTSVNPLSGASSFVCSNECSTAYLQFYSQCVLPRTSIMVVPHALSQFYSSCLPSTPPSAISTINFVQVTSTSISLSWPVPIQSQAQPLALTYQLESASGTSGSSFTSVYSGAQATIPSFIATGLQSNTVYRFRVTAITSAGASPLSAVFTQSTSLAAPSSAATALTTTGFTVVPTITPTLSSTYMTTVQWTDSAGSSSIYYRLQLNDVRTPGAVSQVYYGQSLSTSLSSLISGASYTLSVQSRDSSTDASQQQQQLIYSSWSTAKSIVINVPAAAPNTPTLSQVKLTPSASNSTQQQIDVSWMNVGCGNINCTSVTAVYELQMYSTVVGSLATPVYTPIGSLVPFPLVDGTVKTFQLTGVVASTSPSTVYSFRIRAYSSAGSSSVSAVVSVTTDGVVPSVAVLPTPSYSVDATAKRVRVTFNVLLDPLITQLRFTCKSNASASTTPFDVYIIPLDLVLSSGTTTSSLILPAEFTPSTSYSIRMSARNTFGWSDLSVAQMVTLPGLAPKLVSCVASGPMTTVSPVAFGVNTSIAITFDRPTSAPSQVTTISFLDTFLIFLPSISARYTGAWSSGGSVLTLTMTQIDGARGVTPVIGATQCQLIGALYNADMTSFNAQLLSTDLLRVPLSGSFGTLQPSASNPPGIKSPHLLPTSSVLFVEQDGPAVLVAPTLSQTADYSVSAGSVVMTASATSGLFVSSHTVTPLAVLSGATSYSVLQLASSPVNTLRYSPAPHFVGTDLITITLNGSLGFETWTRIVAVRSVNHAPAISVPSTPLTYNIDANLATAVGVRLAGMTITDEDSVAGQVTEIEFSQPTSSEARFKLADVLPAGCVSNVASIGVWTAVLNLRCAYSTLKSYVAAGSIVFTDSSIDVDASSTVAIRVRVNDHAADVASGSSSTFSSLSTEATYLIMASCASATAPKLIRAQMSNDVTSVRLTFDTSIETTDAVVPCSSLVDASTLAKLGASLTAVCAFTSSSSVTITLGTNAALKVGDTVTLNGAASLVRRCASSSVGAVGSTTVLAPDSPINKPTVKLIGPGTIGVCESLTLEARVEGALGVGALTYVWTASDPSLIPPTAATQSTLSIPSVLLTVGQAYSFTVRVVTAVGISSDVSALSSLVIHRSDTPIPSLTSISPSDTTLEIDQPLSLLAVAAVSECLSGVALVDQGLSFKWTITPSLLSSSVDLVTSAVYPRLVLPANTLTAGTSYTLTLTATQKVQPDLKNTLTYRINAVAPATVININIPPATWRFEVFDSSSVVLTLPSTITSDVSGPYVWSCALLDGSRCTNGVTQSTLTTLNAANAQGTITLSPQTLIAPLTHVFTATTTQVNPTRALAIVTIVVKHAAVVGTPPPDGSPSTPTVILPLPYIELKSSSLLLNLNDPLFITSSLRAADGSLTQPTMNYTYTWTSIGSVSQSSGGGGGGGVASPTLQSINDAASGSTLSIVAKSGSLSIWTAGALMTYRLTIVDTISGQSTFAEMSVTVATPPHGGSFTVVPSTDGMALNTTYIFSASNWIGFGSLRYEYYYIAADNSQIRLGSHIGSALDQDEMFPGRTGPDYFVTVILIVTDSDGYATQQSQQVRVAPNPILMNDPVALNNHLQEIIQELTNTGAVDPLIAIINGQSAWNSAQNSKCAASDEPYKLTWSPAASTSSGSSSNGGSGGASTVQSTKLLIDSITSILTADPSAASSSAVIAACRTLLNDIVTMTSITLSASLSATCKHVVDPSSSVGGDSSSPSSASAAITSPALSSQFATTIALLNLNRRNTDINNGGAYTYNTVSASNRRRRLLDAGSSTATNTTTPTAAILAESTRTLLKSLSSILDRFSTSVLQVPGQLITLPDCTMPSAIRRDTTTTLVSYTFDLDNTTVTYAQNWMVSSGSTTAAAAVAPIDTRMTYSTSNLYSFASNWQTDQLKPLSGMVMTSRTTSAAVPLTQTRANPSMWITLPFNATRCSSAGLCTPKCMTFNADTEVWSFSGVSTTYPSKRNMGVNVSTTTAAYVDCVVTTASTTVALFATSLLPSSSPSSSSSSSTGSDGPLSDAQHPSKRELSRLPPMPPNSQLPSSPKTSAWAVTATMYLYLDSSFISSWLKSQLQKDIVSAVSSSGSSSGGLTMQRVTIDSLSAGSVIAKFTLLPIESQAATSTGTTSNAITTTDAYNSILTQLMSLLSTGQSNKLSAGALTRFTDDLRSAAYVGVRLCVDQTFQVDSCDDNGHGGYAQDNDGIQSDDNGNGQVDVDSDSTSSGLPLYILIIIIVGSVLFLCIVIFLATKCKSSHLHKQTMNKLSTASSAPASNVDEDSGWASPQLADGAPLPSSLPLAESNLIGSYDSQLMGSLDSNHSWLEKQRNSTLTVDILNNVTPGTFVPTLQMSPKKLPPPLPPTSPSHASRASKSKSTSESDSGASSTSGYVTADVSSSESIVVTVPSPSVAPFNSNSSPPAISAPSPMNKSLPPPLPTYTTTPQLSPSSSSPTSAIMISPIASPMRSSMLPPPLPSSHTLNGDNSNVAVGAYSNEEVDQ